MRVVAALVIAAAGYLLGGLVGLPRFLDDERTTADLTDSVAESFGAFAASCNNGASGGTWFVTYGDGRTEVVAVTVNQEGCWFAQRTEGGGPPVGSVPTGRPIRRGCAK